MAAVFNVFSPHLASNSYVFEKTIFRLKAKILLQNPVTMWFYLSCRLHHESAHLYTFACPF